MTFDVYLTGKADDLPRKVPLATVRSALLPREGDYLTFGQPPVSRRVDRVEFLFDDNNVLRRINVLLPAVEEDLLKQIAVNVAESAS